MARSLRVGLQPAVLVAVLAFWWMFPDLSAGIVITILAVQLLLGLLEHHYPARPHWLPSGRELGVHIAAFLVLGGLAEPIRELYRTGVATPLSSLRQEFGADIWPHDWPMLVQLLMVFFIAEFFWYWMHRAEHRWPIVWRLTGHGAHHSFKKLSALNSGLNHPLELLWLTAPAATIGVLFGVGAPAAGAAILTATQASIVHANLDLSSVGIGWLFTTNRHHIHHHSVVLDESNTNYGCAAIVWDRLFGTFADAPTTETGTGPTEPSMWAKFVMPFVEPDDTATAPS